MPGLLLPDDDLYARLGLEPEASFEAVELAWRALLRRHHPDVAGDSAEALEKAKRINVAHDWLADPELRARYDREVMGLEPLAAPADGAVSSRGRRMKATSRRASPGGRRARARSRPSTRPNLATGEPEIRLARFMDRLRTLSVDEYDRLSAAEPPPIAFLATVRRLATAEGRTELDKVEAELAGKVPHERWAQPGVRESLLALAAELVLGPQLDETLDEPFRSRVRERLLRSWDASLEQPRFGPNAAEVAALVLRVGTFGEAVARAIVSGARAARVDPADLPWPDSLDREEDEAQRISAVLAARAVGDALPVLGLDEPTAATARRLAARQGHLVALRHAFPAARYAALVAPWVAATGGDAPPRRGPDVRRAG